MHRSLAYIDVKKQVTALPRPMVSLRHSLLRVTWFRNGSADGAAGGAEPFVLAQGQAQARQPQKVNILAAVSADGHAASFNVADTDRAGPQKPT